MAANGDRREREDLADLECRQARAEHSEDLGLAACQLNSSDADRVRGYCIEIAQLLEHEADEHSWQRGLAPEDTAQRRRQPIGMSVLREVADSPGSQRGE